MVPIYISCCARCQRYQALLPGRPCTEQSSRVDPSCSFYPVQHSFLCCSGYYSQFMRNIHQAFDGRATVSSVASLGFHTLDSPLHKQRQTYNLQEQCAHKAAYLQQHIFSSHSLPVVVMGHSIGLYMAMQAVHMCEGTQDSYSRKETADAPLSRGDSARSGSFHDNGTPRCCCAAGTEFCVLACFEWQFIGTAVHNLTCIHQTLQFTLRAHTQALERCPSVEVHSSTWFTLPP